MGLGTPQWHRIDFTAGLVCRVSDPLRSTGSGYASDPFPRVDSSEPIKFGSGSWIQIQPNKNIRQPIFCFLISLINYAKNWNISIILFFSNNTPTQHCWKFIAENKSKLFLNPDLEVDIFVIKKSLLSRRACKKWDFDRQNWENIILSRVYIVRFFPSHLHFSPSAIPPPRSKYLVLHIYTPEYW